MGWDRCSLLWLSYHIMIWGDGFCFRYAKHAWQGDDRPAWPQSFFFLWGPGKQRQHFWDLRPRHTARHARRTRLQKCLWGSLPRPGTHQERVSPPGRRPLSSSHSCSSRTNSGSILDSKTCLSSLFFFFKSVNSVDEHLEKPLPRTKGRLPWSWKFQMMRVGVGAWKQYSRWAVQSSASAWSSPTRFGKPSSSLQMVPGFPRQWPRVATFFRAKARQRFCPYFPNPLKGWKPPDLVFPHLTCRPGLYPPPSGFCTCDNLHVTFRWHGEPAPGVPFCHSPVRSSHLLSECLCLSSEDVLDVFVLGPLWKIIWFWFCCLFFPLKGTEKLREGGE